MNIKVLNDRPGHGYIIDTDTYTKTGVPMPGTSPCLSYDLTYFKDLVRQLKIKDEQEAIQRYKWGNLPNGLTSEFVERMLYYQGCLMFFYLKELDKWYLLPFVGTGPIDEYQMHGQFIPICFGSRKDDKGKVTGKPFLPADRIYTRKTNIEEDFDLNDYNTGCVLLFDRTPGFLQEYITPMSESQDTIIKMIAEALMMAHTAGFASSGAILVNVGSEQAQGEVVMAARNLRSAVLSGTPYLPVTDSTGHKMEAVGAGAPYKTQEYLALAQAYDNIRLAQLGINSGGLMQKAEHMLQVEAMANGGNAQATLDDGLAQRQQAADLMNLIWGLNVFVEINESCLGIDRNMDGEISGSENSVTPDVSTESKSETEGGQE